MINGSVARRIMIASGNWTKEIERHAVADANAKRKSHRGGIAMNTQLKRIGKFFFRIF